ncbi:polysaccharide biosynthesis/export family protein [Methylobacter sp. YRD-M1]|uniref:polysaccharide biosynthesis/export family protein n=1 Tax=Methylobacter sp. YRD-M1 TaxID=2911520 RepID=UPI00227B1317|nr:polysaccharide biosynthesis/export family protein [Methylobacter sp. YRD-M1]WAK01151.1 polysaccharide export protein [Methylobacter sp. YRD-M1]
MRIFLLLAVFIFQTAHADSNQYTVNSGDILDISVWNEEALQKEVRVLPDGSISFPLAGSISVAGKSISQIHAILKDRLAEFIADPVVNISVKSAEGNSIYVIGQVKKPGQFVMYQPMDVMQMLSLAGGLTAFAKANDIVILRRNGDKSESIAFKYGEVEDGDKLENNHLLRSGDVIVVP